MGREQFHLDPATYVEAIRAELPVYDELQAAVAVASHGVDARRILDLGVGTGETALGVLAEHADAALVAIDASVEMVAVAAARLPGAEVRVGRLEDPLPDGPFDLVVSALAVHHLSPDGKRRLFGRVARALGEEGRFVLADVVVPDDPADQVTPLEPGVDLPDPLDDQLDWLAAAGLEPTVTWTHRDLAVVTADRAS